MNDVMDYCCRNNVEINFSFRSSYVVINMRRGNKSICRHIDRYLDVAVDAVAIVLNEMIGEING